MLPVGYGFTIMKDPIRPMVVSHRGWVLILLKSVIKYGMITIRFHFSIGTAKQKPAASWLLFEVGQRKTTSTATGAMPKMS